MRISGGRVALALAVLAVSHSPVPGHAAPAPPTIVVSPTELTPYHSGGCWNPANYPCYSVRGTAEPGVTVTVTVTDDPPTGHSVAVSTRAATTPDPAAGIAPGDWRVPAPNVTDLGGHGPDPSTLIFTAVAQADDGSTSAPVPFPVTKTSMSPGDTTPPRIRVTPPTPPAIWSRSCVLPCGTPARENPGCLITPRPLDPNRPLDALPPGCSGDMGLAGRVEDDIPEAFGIASEVADVTVTILRSSDQVVWAEYHAFVRRGTQAFYNVVLNINDFQAYTSYDWIISAVDAAGNQALGTGGSFFVAPF